MIFVAGRAFCQKITVPATAAGVLSYYKKAGLGPLKANGTGAANKKASKAFYITASGYPLPLIAADYYTSTIGFFCKKELQLEKITKVPFKFRLGSVEQCDRLEGKGVFLQRQVQQHR